VAGKGLLLSGEKLIFEARSASPAILVEVSNSDNRNSLDN
jgi:hypothetical protein